jgi:hypothetical protein
MLVDNGSMFTEPIMLYKYNENDVVDVTDSFAFTPYKDDSALPLNSTYHFIGYSLSASDVANGVITDPVIGIISKNITIYAVFAE